jgi:hypothetical protein
MKLINEPFMKLLEIMTMLSNNVQLVKEYINSEVKERP